MGKKMIWILCGIVFAGAILVGGSLAYFTAATDATNVVAIGNVKLRATLYDLPQDERTSAQEREMEVVRGKRFQSKSVRIQNFGSTTAFIRVRLVAAREAENQYYSQLEVSHSDLDIRENLKYDENSGWFYYKQALPPDDETDNPLTLEGWFTVSHSTSQGDLPYGVDLIYEVQAVQEEYIELGADGYPIWPADDLILPNYTN